MKCNQCHEEIDPINWKFCPHCGGILTDERILFLIARFFKQRRVIYSILFFEIIFIGLVAYLLVDSSLKIRQKDKEIQALLNQEKEISLDWKLKDKIFPLTYTAENQQLVWFNVSSEVFTKLKVEAVVDGLTTIQTKIINIKPGGNSFSMGPEITSEGYRKLANSQKFNFKIKVIEIGHNEKEKGIVLDENRELFFYSTNDLAWTENGTSNAKYLIRLVDKDRSEVRDLVRKAADHMTKVGGQQQAMIGELGDDEEIKRQLEAIFLALAEDYQVRYVMAPYSYDSLDVQKIKSPSQVLNEKSGLCIELALTIAAALENIGLNPVVVVTAGHAWPGVKLSTADDQYFFIESTLLDKSYQEAVKVGNDNWEEIRKIPGEYKLLELTNLRSEGILPIKY